jgi:hypothetical protein
MAQTAGADTHTSASGPAETPSPSPGRPGGLACLKATLNLQVNTLSVHTPEDSATAMSETIKS